MSSVSSEGSQGSLPTKIFFGLFAGFVVGLVTKELVPAANVDWTVVNVLQPIGSVFMRLILMVLVPMIFTAIVLGILDLSGEHSLGVIGLKTLGWAAVFSCVSITIALSLVAMVRPGERLSPEQRSALISDYRAHDAGKPVPTQGGEKPMLASLVELIPTNPIADAASALTPTRTGGGIIGVMVAALVTGLALHSMKNGVRTTLVPVLEGIFALTSRIVEFAMTLAPYCVFALGAASAARIGINLFVTLAAYVACVVGGLLLEGVGFFPIVIRLFANRSPVAFFKSSREAILTAFGTASSNATMPVSIRVAEKELKVPRGIARFAVSLGAACNHNGTALFEAVTVLFIAQLFGLQLSTPEQLQVAVLCMLSSVGAGGIPGGGIAMTTTVLVTLGLPAEAIGIVLGVDRILDMSRTALNVTGDLAIAVLVGGRQAEAERTNAE